MNNGWNWDRLTLRPREITVNTKVFWDAIIECLVQFHGMEQNNALKRVSDFQDRLLQTPEYIREDVCTIIYHSNPFDVACDLARTQLDVSEYRKPYQEILERCGW